MNLAGKLLENYENMPEKICLIQKHRKTTYKQLYKKVANFKKYLQDRGIKKGNKILVLVPMSEKLYITLLSIWSIGAIPCFMDAGFIKNGIKKNEFNPIDALIGITKYTLYANINKNLRNLKCKINANVIDKLNDLSLELEVEKLEEDFTGILTYTSGTTGIPKIVARTHQFLAYQGKILEETIKYDKNDIELSSIPIFTLSNINVGITTVIADGNYSNLGNSNAKKLIEQIEKNKINRLMAAPGLLNTILKECIKRKLKIEQITKIYTGGGAVFLDFIENLKNVFPNAKIVTLYGSTEAEPIAMLDIDNMTQKEVQKTKNGSGILAGSIIGVEDCKIIKTGIKEIGEITEKQFLELQTQIGEIVVSGKNVLDGYVGGIGDKENKFSVEKRKYHRTGDIGFLDENNKLWLRGRIKEPFFNIEAALHAKFDIGKTAIFKYKEKIILVLERDNKIFPEEIKEAIQFEKIDEIKYVKKIPVDKRHSTKVDYKELQRILGME